MIRSIVSFVFSAAFCLHALAQTNQDELQLMQSLYGMDKRDIVAEFVELNETQQEAFWLIYDEYESKRREIGQSKFKLLQRYANDYGEIQPQDADNFMKQAIPIRIKSDQLLDAYYDKIKSKTDAVTAMQFYQIETYLGDMIRMELLEGIYTTKKQ